MVDTYDIRVDVVTAIRAFTSATITEAEAAADAIIILFDDPPPPPDGVCPECDGLGYIPRYSGDPASPAERCFACDGSGEIK